MADERRLVTVLFADVVGSTTLGESLDPEELRRLLSRLYEIARDVVEGRGGTLEKFIGDAAMAIFGVPQAHDDDARRALDAALELRDRVRDDPGLGERLPIRVGVNTGEVVASRDRDQGDFIVTGDAVNVAARLQQVAEPWQVLASARTASAAAGAYEFGELRTMELKGKASPLAVRPVVGRSTAVHAGAPLVGRDADIAELNLVAGRAFRERRPYLVTLIAPAGTGKSRLVEEFLAHVDQLAPDIEVEVAQCLPYGQRLTYWPMRTLLLGLLNLSEEEAAPAEIRSRARAWLEEAGADDPAATGDLLAVTVGALESDVLDRAEIFAAWRTTLELAGSRRPLVLVVEDLHWSSDSLLDLVEFIFQPRTAASLLMIALTRPELLDRRPSWGGGRRNHLTMALEPLDERSLERLIENILDGPASELTQIVSARSEGNPFYAGEIVRSLVERGVDLRDPAAVTAAAVGLPDTVQATVLARLDALEPAARRLLQLGSIFGREFRVDGVVALDDPPHHPTSGALDQLIERELLRSPIRGSFAFSHILIRDVAYGMLPRVERARLHAAAGRWLEALAAGREHEMAELIAFHFREAAVLAAATGDQDTETESRAVEWLRRAAEVAAGARGVAEATSHLRGAIELAPPELQPDLYQRLGELHGTGDQSVQAFADALRLGREQHRSADFLLANLAQELLVLCRWFASVARQPTESEIERLVEAGRQLLPQTTDRRARARYLIARGFVPFWLRNSGARQPTESDRREAETSLSEGLALAEGLDDPALISAALDASTTGLGWAAARDVARRRLAMAQRLPVEERLDALGVVSWSSALLGDLSIVVDAADESINLIEHGQNPGFSLAGDSWRAYAFALIGRWEEVVASVERERHLWIKADSPAAGYGLQGLLSGIDMARGRVDDELLQRWRLVAAEIVSRFDRDHPTAALAAVVELEMDGIVDAVGHPERYLDHLHYVEHAVAICADRAHPVRLAAIDRVIELGAADGIRVLEAQAHRLKGILHGDAAELERSLELFEAIGATRYAARARADLGLVRHDDELLAAAINELDTMGELQQLQRLDARRSRR